MRGSTRETVSVSSGNTGGSPMLSPQPTNSTAATRILIARDCIAARRMLASAMSGSSKDSKNPFASLEKLRADLPAGPAPSAPKEKPVAKGPAWAVVRMERKGRGGKEATIIEKLGLNPAALEQWCKELKQALGCGGSVDGDEIVLQGDLRQRLPAVLTAKGVAKVTVG